MDMASVDCLLEIITIILLQDYYRYVKVMLKIENKKAYNTPQKLDRCI